jgi:hypothetical protein
VSRWPRYGIALVGILVTAPSLSSYASERAAEPRSRVELSLRSWLFTSGEMKWSHNASGLDPTLGNPSSKLTFKDNDTHIIEFGANVHLTRRWYLQGDFGVSVDFDRGTLIDDDYGAGQHLVSRTSSAITGTGTWYVNGNVGYRATEFPNGRGHLSDLPPVVVPPAKLVRHTSTAVRGSPVPGAGSPRHYVVGPDYTPAASIRSPLGPPRVYRRVPR